MRAEEPHQRVEAHCLELDLAGRGKNVNDALVDLAKTIEESFLHEWKELTPSYSREADPLLVEMFEGRRTDLRPDYTDYQLLQRVVARFEADLVPAVAKARASAPKPQMVFERIAA